MSKHNNVKTVFLRVVILSFFLFLCFLGLYDTVVYTRQPHRGAILSQPLVNEKIKTLYIGATEFVVKPAKLSPT